MLAATRERTPYFVRAKGHQRANRRDMQADLAEETATFLLYIPTHSTRWSRASFEAVEARLKPSARNGEHEGGDQDRVRQVE